MNMRI